MSFTFRNDFSRYLKRAKPALPDNLRSLIDDAVASGRITRVETGATTFRYPRWDGRKGQLVNSEEVRQHFPSFYAGRERAAQEASAKATQRRQEVKAMLAEGLGWREIAVLRGEGVEATRKLCQSLRRELIAPQGEGHPE